VTRYTYGDSELAGDRLDLVARLFEPTSRPFLRAAGPAGPSLAVDLGCGPGATTRLVHDTVGARRTIGLDRSPAFASRARTATGLGFIAADVIGRDLPFRSADLLYARLLLAHVADPVAAVARWSDAATIGGRILVDDLEVIDADDDVFRTYLDDVALAVVRAQGGALFVGPILHAARDPDGLERVHDAVATFAPPARDTARVFGMNLRVLTERREVDRQTSLEAALDAIAQGSRASDPVRWHVRQLAWERTR
jgi:trans-aconitate 2-methyltransferase